MSRLKKKFKEEVKPVLLEKFGYKNSMLVPSLKKIVISMGLAEATKDKNAVQACQKEMTLLSGQKPILTHTKKAIANFKSRKGQVIGLKVTLRKKRMYEFFDRFCNIVAPRIRDFRGFPLKCDGRGSYSLGLTDQQVFPEINLDEVKRTQGMNITFVTSAQTDDECVELLRMLGFPFKALTQNESGGEIIMAHQDPIADMLTRLRNAMTARRRYVDMPLSSLKHDVLKVLEKQGFVEHILIDEEHKKMRVFLKYAGGRAPILQGLKRISKPSLRKYITKNEIPKISNGLGLAIVSTSQGVVDGETARQKGIGGELLCYIW